MTTNLSRNERKRIAIFEQVNHLAWLLDNSIYLPIIHYRIGLEAVIGLIPGLGDIAGMLVSSIIVIQAIRLGAPGKTLLRMVLNIAFETIVGMVPILGDVFDATFKANIRNVRLLTLALDQPSSNRTLKSTGKLAIVIVLAVLVAIIVLIGGLGVALFWGLMSLRKSL